MGLGRHSQLSIWTDLFLLEHCFRVFPLLIDWVPLHQDGVVLLIIFCVLCVWGRHSSTCSYPLLQRRRGFLHHIAWLLPKATPAGINLSLASKTTFLQTCCSKKEVSHLQSLPRNFCVDSTFSDFDFWFFFCLFCISNTVSCLHQGETFSRTEERIWHILCLSRLGALRGKNGILRADVLYISDSCCMLGNTFLIVRSEYTICISCLLVNLFVWICYLVWFGLFFGLFGLFGFVGSYRFIFIVVAFPGSSHENWHSILRNGLKKLGTVYGLFMAGQPLISLCKALLKPLFLRGGYVRQGGRWTSHELWFKTPTLHGNWRAEHAKMIHVFRTWQFCHYERLGWQQHSAYMCLLGTVSAGLEV